MYFIQFTITTDLRNNSDDNGNDDKGVKLRPNRNHKDVSHTNQPNRMHSVNYDSDIFQKNTKNT